MKNLCLLMMHDESTTSASMEQVKEEKYLNEEPLPLFDDTPIPEITTSQFSIDDKRRIASSKRRKKRWRALTTNDPEVVMTTSSDLDDLTSSNLDGKKKPCA
jgi:hypothetical protein